MTTCVKKCPYSKLYTVIAHNDDDISYTETFFCDLSDGEHTVHVELDLNKRGRPLRCTACIDSFGEGLSEREQTIRSVKLFIPRQWYKLRRILKTPVSDILGHMPAVYWKLRKTRYNHGN